MAIARRDSSAPPTGLASRAYSAVLAVLLALTFALIPMHMVTEGGRRDPQNPLKKSRRELLCALSLVVKYAQRVAVLSSFPVEWPEKVSSAQTAHQSAGLNADTVKAISIGCLAEEQSIELLMSWRLLTPVLLMTACLIASPGSSVVGVVLKTSGSTMLHRIGESIPSGSYVRVLLEWSCTSLPRSQRSRGRSI